MSEPDRFLKIARFVLRGPYLGVLVGVGARSGLRRT
jgi:hypothetical protein